MSAQTAYQDQEKLLLELFRAATEQEQKIAIGMLLHCAEQRLPALKGDQA